MIEGRDDPTWTFGRAVRLGAGTGAAPCWDGQPARHALAVFSRSVGRWGARADYLCYGRCGTAKGLDRASQLSRLFPDARCGPRHCSKRLEWAAAHFAQRWGLYHMPLLPGGYRRGSCNANAGLATSYLSRGVGVMQQVLDPGVTSRV